MEGLWSWQLNTVQPVGEEGKGKVVKILVHQFLLRGGGTRVENVVEVGNLGGEQVSINLVLLASLADEDGGRGKVFELGTRAARGFGLDCVEKSPVLGWLAAGKYNAIFNACFIDLMSLRDG